MKSESKTGILTYQNTLNFGAALQCYALYTYLSRRYPKRKFEIINYKSAIDDRYTINGILKNASSSNRTKIRNIVSVMMSAKKKKKFNEFKKYLQFSEEYTQGTLKNIDGAYESYIIGSDQLWNYKINNGDDHYFLDIVEDKERISTYATSIGLSTVNNEFKNKCKRFIAHYGNIAVREKTAAELLEKTIKRKVLTVLDPVFLLEKEDWKQLAKEKNQKGEALYYIFNKEYVSKANNIARSNNDIKKIVKLNGDVKLKDYLNPSIKVAKNCGPIDFLSYIDNSNLILTDSFHCVAFSIMLHKNFVAFIDDEVMETNSRMKNLLEITGLQSRIYSGNSFSINEKIDWESVDQKIKAERDKSIQYLNSIFKNDH